MTQLKFETVWRNYPRVDPCVDPNTGKAPLGFDNQCAMRLGRALELSGVSFASFRGKRCSGRSSIIFLANYWRRPGESGTTRTGDHIDLWNGYRMTEYFSWVRIHFGVTWEGQWSDYRRAPRTMFWAIA